MSIETKSTIRNIVIINFKSTIIREIERFTRQSIESSFFSLVWIDDRVLFQQNFNRFIEAIDEYRVIKHYRNWLNVNSQTTFLRTNIVTSKSYFIDETSFKFFFVVSNRIKFKSRSFSSNSIVFSSIENFVDDSQLLIDLVVNNSTNSIVNKFVNSIFQITHVVNNFVNQNISNSITQIDSNFVSQKSISTNSTSRSQFDMTINDWQNIEFSQ